MATADTMKCLFSIIFFTLIIKGSCGCSANNLIIGTTRTWREIEGKPEWNVTVTNNCFCPQSQIKLLCEGFQTVERVDPRILLSIDDNSCLLINGNTLYGFKTIHFSYAWDPPFMLWPAHSLVDC